MHEKKAFNCFCLRFVFMRLSKKNLKNFKQAIKFEDKKKIVKHKILLGKNRIAHFHNFFLMNFCFVFFNQPLRQDKKLKLSYFRFKFNVCFCHSHIL